MFLRPLDGNSSDKVTLASAVEALQQQLHAPDTEPSIFVADSGVYSEANMRRFNAAHIDWISRVPETSKEAKGLLESAVDSADWQDSPDGQTHWFTRIMTLPQGQERWVVVRTNAGEARAQATLKRHVDKAEQSWRQKLWHASTQILQAQITSQPFEKFSTIGRQPSALKTSTQSARIILPTCSCLMFHLHSSRVDSTHTWTPGRCSTNHR